MRGIVVKYNSPYTESDHAHDHRELGPHFPFFTDRPSRFTSRTLQ